MKLLRQTARSYNALSVPFDFILRTPMGDRFSAQL